MYEIIYLAKGFLNMGVGTLIVANVYLHLIQNRYMFRSFTVLHCSGVRRNFFSGGRGSTNSVEDRGQRERGSGGGSPLVRGSGESCNLVQEISFHIVKFS